MNDGEDYRRNELFSSWVEQVLLRELDSGVLIKIE